LPPSGASRREEAGREEVEGEALATLATLIDWVDRAPLDTVGRKVLFKDVLYFSLSRRTYRWPANN